MSDTHDQAITPAQVELSAPRRELHPFVQAALAVGPDPATIRELLQLQREWQADQARGAYTRALIGLHADLPAVIRRDREVDYGSGAGRVRYTHLSLAGLLEAVIPVLATHGFALSWEARTGDRDVTVTAQLTHREGHREMCTLSAPPDAQGRKSPPQAIASTITLLQRYSAQSLLGVATADLDEPSGAHAADPGAVDPARNLRAVAGLRAAGLELNAAEAEVGRPAAEWTSADLDRIRAWYIEQKRLCSGDERQK